MKFDKYFPTDQLKPYVKYYVVSENELESRYKVFPTPGLVIGFQYKGQLACIKDQKETNLSSAGITGVIDTYRVFKNSASIGTLLVYFTEIGFTQFVSPPAHELFNLSLSLKDIFNKNTIEEVEERLSTSGSDILRINIIEQFLIGHLKDIQTDKLIVEALRLIYLSGGSIRISELIQKLCISQSPFEKRFRKLVGTTAKKFASIVRFNSVLASLSENKTLTETCYENYFFDQAHFIKDFKQYTGETPENFKRFL